MYVKQETLPFEFNGQISWDKKDYQGIGGSKFCINITDAPIFSSNLCGGCQGAHRGVEVYWELGSLVCIWDRIVSIDL